MMSVKQQNMLVELFVTFGELPPAKQTEMLRRFDRIILNEEAHDLEFFKKLRSYLLKLANQTEQQNLCIQ